MKFGKTIETSTKELPEEWRPYVIQYKQLKKSIKQIVQELDNTFKRLNIALPAADLEDARGAAEAASASTESRNDAALEDTAAAADGAGPAARAGTPETIVYCIEKDISGLVYPVIRVNMRRPSPPPLQPPAQDAEATAHRAAATQPTVAAPLRSAAADERGDMTSLLEGAMPGALGPQPSAMSWPVLPSSFAPPASAEGCSAVVDAGAASDTDEVQVVVRLEADQLFFDQLVEYINRIQQFVQRYTGAYCTNISHMGVGLAAVTSPYKQDYRIWREIFRLYVDSEVWSHSSGDARQQSTSKEGQKRFGDFARHIEAVGLAKQFQDPMSAQLLMSFYKLNLELTHMRLLQEVNEQATRKIIKKHDKRTHLVAMTQFPRLMTIDTELLTRALVHTIYSGFVSVVPQIDDYSCPMCLSIAWRPLRLQCRHVFCSRCIVKASRRHIFDCPVCRSKRAVYNAGVANIDHAMLNFLMLYFPKEVKEKQRDTQQDISEEETRAVVAAQSRDHPCTVM